MSLNHSEWPPTPLKKNHLHHLLSSLHPPKQGLHNKIFAHNSIKTTTQIMKFSSAISALLGTNLASKVNAQWYDPNANKWGNGWSVLYGLNAIVGYGMCQDVDGKVFTAASRGILLTSITDDKEQALYAANYCNPETHNAFSLVDCQILSPN